MKERGVQGRLSKPALTYIAENFGRKRTEDIAAYVNRSVASVRTHAVDLIPLRNGPWNAEKDIALRSRLGRASIEDVARSLGRSVEAVQERVKILRALSPTHTPLSRAEILEVRTRYGRLTDDEIAVVFRRPPQMIEEVVKRYRLRKDKAWAFEMGGKTDMPRWTSADVALLKKLYPMRGAVEVAAMLNRSTKSVMSKASRLGIGKTEERMREMGRENVSQRER